jgi:hypothetical protein
VRRYSEFSIGAGAHVQTVTEQRSKRDATAAPRAAWKSYGIQREIQIRRGGWAREGIGTQYNGGDGDGAEPLPRGVHESVNGPRPPAPSSIRLPGGLAQPPSPGPCTLISQSICFCQYASLNLTVYPPSNEGNVMQ